MKFWIVMGPLWVLALAALAGITILPADFDVFYHDTYVIVAKSHVILATLLLVILPLLALTIRHFRSARS